MKAKEYFQNHIAVLPKNINGIAFSVMLAALFNEFFKEMRTTVKELKQESSKLSKIREFEKKWIAITNMARAHFHVPEHYRRALGDETADIEVGDLIAMEQLYMAWIETKLPEIHRRLHDTFVARDRLQPVARPKFSVTYDALWRSLLSGIAGQQGF